MDLGTGEKTIVRGVCTGGYIPCASAGADGLSTLEAVVELQLTRELPTQLLAEAFRTNKCRGMSDSAEL